MALAENGKFMAIHIYPVVAQIFKSIDQSGSPTSTAQLDFHISQGMFCGLHHLSSKSTKTPKKGSYLNLFICAFS